jgi:hypothetical protein
VQSGAPQEEELVWIGIGGAKDSVSNIIQVGTFAWVPPDGGKISEGIWYERVPGDNGTQSPDLSVLPGDHIYASITSVAQTPNEWSVALVDGSDFATFSQVLHFESLESYPSFVVENPAPPDPASFPLTPFPRWGSVAFTNMQVCIGGTWRAAAALPAIRVDMISSRATVASASPLTSQSSFTATQH